MTLLNVSIIQNDRFKGLKTLLPSSASSINLSTSSSDSVVPIPTGPVVVFFFRLRVGIFDVDASITTIFSGRIVSNRNWKFKIITKIVSTVQMIYFDLKVFSLTSYLLAIHTVKIISCITNPFLGH